MTNEVKLKVAIEEIKDILRKHDIAGAVQLHAPGCGEYMIHLNPSYSCAYIYDDEKVHFYSKAKDFKNKDEQFQKQADTSNMLKILTDVTVMNFGHLDYLSKFLDEKLEAVHTDPIHKPGK